MKRTSGTYVTVIAAGDTVSAFVPRPLPPDPPLELDGNLARRLEEASTALQRLDLAQDLVPSIEWFLYAFVRKEAVITSQIEGTQSTLVDLLQFESESSGAPADADLKEVGNYLEALAYARAQLMKAKGLPISVRLLNEAHKRLMRGVRGAGKAPGEIRRTQNWIGGSRPGNAMFVPPPPQRLQGALSDLENYLHSGEGAPFLVRAGLAHAQFETIHPYLDGNGRIGRLLIALLLEHWGLLRSPLLYISLHFKRHRAEYYRRFDAIRTDGDWEGWLDFFLDGVAKVASEAVGTAKDLSQMVADDRARVLALSTSSMAAARLLEFLPEHPIVTAKKVESLLDVSTPTAGRVLDQLVDAGVLVEKSGRQRDRWFAYDRYVERLRTETR